MAQYKVDMSEGDAHVTVDGDTCARFKTLESAATHYVLLYKEKHRLWLRAAELETDNTKLRKLIRCEQIEPPFDVADDCTTQFAVELAYAKERIATLEAALRDVLVGNWSPTGIQEILGTAGVLRKGKMMGGIQAMLSEQLREILSRLEGGGYCESDECDVEALHDDINEVFDAF